MEEPGSFNRLLKVTNSFLCVDKSLREGSFIFLVFSHDQVYRLENNIIFDFLLMANCSVIYLLQYIKIFLGGSICIGINLKTVQNTKSLIFRAYFLIQCRNIDLHSLSLTTYCAQSCPLTIMGFAFIYFPIGKGCRNMHFLFNRRQGFSDLNLN